jgi:hypothetical protein
MPAASKPDREWLALCMGLACGSWGWSPEQFWKATPLDVALVLSGAQRLQGQEFGAEDVAALRELLNEKADRKWLRHSDV